MIRIKGLVFTRKSSALLEKYNKYTFEVADHWTKVHVRWVVEKIFSVPVANVNILRLPPIINRKKKFNRVKRKRAVVTLNPNRQITLRFD